MRLEHLLQDVRHAARGLLRNPGFTATAVAVIALGISSNTAVFSIVDAVLLHPLPYPEPERIVQLVSNTPMGHMVVATVSRFVCWRDNTGVFELLAAYEPAGASLDVTLDRGRFPAHAARVSKDYFPLFGVPLIAGDAFTSQEDSPAGPPTVVLGEKFWASRFLSQRSIIGRRILIGGKPYRVAGVAGPDLARESPLDLYLPLRPDPNSSDQTSTIRVAGRLKPRITLEIADRQLRRTTWLYAQRFLNSLSASEYFGAMSLREVVAGELRGPLLLLLGAVGFLLLVTCANVANLILARASRRSAEIATRAALGAARSRLLRQFLIESMLLALVGGALGAVVGFTAVKVFLGSAPHVLPHLAHPSLTVNPRLLASAILLSLATGLLFGLAPAISSSRSDLSSVFKEGSAQGGTRRTGFRTALVMAEIAIALVLLAGAGMMIRLFVDQRSHYPGFEPDDVLTLEAAVAEGSPQESTASVDPLDAIRLQLNRDPGVVAAAVASSLPLEASLPMAFAIDSRPLFNGPFHGIVAWRSVSPEFFKVMRLPLLKGRWFTENDVASSFGVAIINRAMARKYWPDNDPVGDTITVGGILASTYRDRSRRIVGIVADLRDEGVSGNRSAAVYLPRTQVKPAFRPVVTATGTPFLVVRTSGDPGAAENRIMDEVRTASSRVRIGRIRTMNDVVAASLARAQFTMTLLSIFAVIALLLAASGIYAAMSYSVEQRRREIGIRMAVGASPNRVREMILGHAARIAGAGVAFGAFATFALSRVLESTMYGMQGWDTTSFVAVAVLLCLVALAAAYSPARRATLVDPVDALRDS